MKTGLRGAGKLGTKEQTLEPSLLLHLAAAWQDLACPKSSSQGARVIHTWEIVVARTSGDPELSPSLCLKAGVTSETSQPL